MLVEPWRLTLLGHLKAEQNLTSISRFRTRKAASLFAFLACHINRSHAREELADRFWPEDPPETGRTKLRLALTSLRHQLEPVGVPAGAVLSADRTHVRLNAEAIETDVAAFEADLQTAGQAATAPCERLQLLLQAVHRYGGDLLPGDYEEWALQERERLRHLYLDALAQIVEAATEQDDPRTAIAYAHRLIQEDPLQEEAYLALMRLYLQTGRPHDAAKQYVELASILEASLGTLPGEEAQALAADLPLPPTPRNAPASLSSRTSYREKDETSPGALSGSEAAVPDVSVQTANSAPVTTPSQDAACARLPLFLTRCFGRAEAIEMLAALLDAEVGADLTARQDLHFDFNTALRIETSPYTIGNMPTSCLVTLLGPGGAGKTRLAVELGRFLQSRTSYPIVFVGLAEVTERERIVRAIADALRLPHTANADPLTQIVESLQSRPALLLLDNFEQLLPDGAMVVQTLLTHLPELRCLVTSRHHLGLPGERIFPVEPLPVPVSQQLFLDRAQAARPDFQITPHNARSVALLCEQLEGIPLALELAAAWIGVLTPAQMLARMDKRFDLLISRREDRTPRHRALHAAIAWSYALLSPELQHFLMRLAVFRGGCTERAAQEVGEAGHALHLLAQLRERSLVVAEESEDGMRMRFRLLESIREFAEAQLTEAAHAAAYRLHAAHFLAFAEEADRNLSGPDQATWFARLEPEQPNIATALDRLAEDAGATEALLRLTVAMRLFWRTQGRLEELKRRLALALERPGAETCLPAYGLGIVEIGLVASMQGDQETARAYAQRALELARKAGYPNLAASALNTLGNAAKRLREYDTAQSYYTQCRDLSHEIGDRRSEATAIANLGNLAQEQADYPQAAACYQESIAAYRQMQHKQGLVIQLYNLAGLYVQREESARAAPLLAECLPLCRELHDTPTILHVLEVFGFIADEGDRSDLSVQLYAAAARLRQSLGLPMSRPGRVYMDEMLQAARQKLGDAYFDLLWQTGTDASLDESIALTEQIAPQTEPIALDRAG